jgi:hypothetical protein
MNRIQTMLVGVGATLEVGLARGLKASKERLPVMEPIHHQNSLLVNHLPLNIH